MLGFRAKSADSYVALTDLYVSFDDMKVSKRCLLTKKIILTDRFSNSIDDLKCQKNIL